MINYFTIAFRTRFYCSLWRHFFHQKTHILQHLFWQYKMQNNAFFNAFTTMQLWPRYEYKLFCKRAVHNVWFASNHILFTHCEYSQKSYYSFFTLHLSSTLIIPFSWYSRNDSILIPFSRADRDPPKLVTNPLECFFFFLLSLMMLIL